MKTYIVKGFFVQAKWVKNPETFTDFKTGKIYSPQFEKGGYWHELYHLYQEQRSGLLTWHMKLQNEIIRTGSLVVLGSLFLNMIFYSQDFAIAVASLAVMILGFLGSLEWGIEIPAILYQKEMEKRK